MKIKTLLPAGKSLHGALATHYTQLGRLIHDLRESRFSGYLKLEFWEYEGYLIFDTGNMVQSYERNKNKLNSGITAFLSIQKRFREKDGLISTFVVDAEFVPFLFGKFENKEIKEENNLKTKPLQSLIDDAKMSIDLGFIDIVFGANRMWASLYLMNGQVVAVASKNDEGKERFEKGKSELYNRILRLADTIENKVSIKSCGALKSYEENQNFNQILELVDLSDFVLTLIKRLETFLNPLLTNETADDLFTRLWTECSSETGIKSVKFLKGQFTGLEKTTLPDFGYLFSKVLKKLKPIFDDLTKKYSFMDQIVNSYTLKNSEFLSNPDLISNILYYKNIKIK
jgi:hypothetical protein